MTQRSGMRAGRTGPGSATASRERSFLGHQFQNNDDHESGRKDGRERFKGHVHFGASLGRGAAVEAV